MRTPFDIERFNYAARTFEFGGHTYQRGERFAVAGLEPARVEALWKSGAIDHDAHDPKTVSSAPGALGETDSKLVSFKKHAPVDFKQLKSDEE